MTNDISMGNIRPPRILVVDDEQRIRDACQILLSEEGYEVATADDGDVGLRMIEAEHFDIILLDLMLPALSGLDVLTQVHALHPDTVVIVITGYATLEHSIEAMKKGAFDFIPKPFTPDQLRMVVSKAIKYTRALQDIADTKSRLRVMVNRLSDGVMATDNSKRVVLANPAFLHLIGYRGESVLGRMAEDFITCEPLLGLIDQALAMPRERFAELNQELAGGQGQDRILNASCTPFRDRIGHNIGTITVLHDITALKKMDQMKSDFVSLVSHEIRSPMNSLLMQIKVIMDGLAGDITEKQKEILGRASEKISNLINMASELLDLAQIESGLITQEKEELNIPDLLADQVAFHQAGAREKGLEISLESPDRLNPVLANRRNMEEVVSNLITNAIKYSPRGGRITVSAGAESGYVVIRVSDTGIGIPEEELDKIFNRFYRVKDERTRYVNGTGLGLSIVKSIVEAHHGNIQVKSRPGEGSTFIVYLPFSES